LRGNVARAPGAKDRVARAAKVKRLPIVYFSDVLCVWAFFAELRLAEVRRAFGEQVELEYRFCPVFGDVPGKIASAWGSRGGYEGFGDHVRHAAQAFPEVTLHPDLWRNVRPASSASPHLYLKAVQLGDNEGKTATGTFERALRAMREAFFVRGLDIARREVQRGVGVEAGVGGAQVQDYLEDGRAHAALSADYKDAENLGVKGSPTMILNEGRQKLFGNVGYRIIEANIQELLRDPNPDQASWC
jgi:predicted DsbA family dithiol-disulfide isomerase